MTEGDFDKFIETLPSMNLAQEVLDSGHPACYMSDEYPGLILEEFPDGRLHSIEVDLETGESIVLEVLKEARTTKVT